MGDAAYTRMLREQDLLPYDAASLWAFAQRGVRHDGSSARVARAARSIAAKTWQQIANEVKADHPDASKMIEAHQQVVDAPARTWCRRI